MEGGGATGTVGGRSVAAAWAWKERAVWDRPLPWPAFCAGRAAKAAALARVEAAAALAALADALAAARVSRPCIAACKWCSRWVAGEGGCASREGARPHCCCSAGSRGLARGEHPLAAARKCLASGRGGFSLRSQDRARRIASMQLETFTLRRCIPLTPSNGSCRHGWASRSGRRLRAPSLAAAAAAARPLQRWAAHSAANPSD